MISNHFLLSIPFNECLFLLKSLLRDYSHPFTTLLLLHSKFIDLMGILLLKIVYLDTICLQIKEIKLAVSIPTSYFTLSGVAILLS